MKINECMHVYANAYAYVYAYVYTVAYTYVYVYIYMCVCVCMYVYVYVYMYMRVYMYMLSPLLPRVAHYPRASIPNQKFNFLGNSTTKCKNQKQHVSM